MFVYEKFKEAESILLSRISMRQYIYDNIDSTANLDAVHINCPIHDDSTASARYFENTDTFYCYGCLHGGSVIVLHRYVLKREIGEPDESTETFKCKVSYAYALINLAKLYKIPIPSFYEADKEFIKPIKINSLDIGKAVIGFKPTEIKLEGILSKLKNKDYTEYLKLVTVVDRYESLGLPKDVLGSVYLGLCRKYST